MKFSILSNELQRVFNLLSGVVPSKSTLPILENFLFEVSNDKLNITATDLDIAMSVTVDVKGAQKGKIAIPAKRLSETVRSLPNTEIKFTADESSNKIEMMTQTGEYRLTGESSENYPMIPSFKSNEELNIDNQTLKRLITKTSFAVSTDDLRPAMMGILFQIKKSEIRAAATDGHRLARIITSVSSNNKMERDVVIPAKALNLLLKSFENAQCSVSFNETHVRFSMENITITSRMIEEKYPNYESVIPADNDKKLTVDKNQLLASVRRTALYASSTTHQVRLSLKKGNVIVSAEDIDFGSEAHETISCDYTADPIDIGFNASYIVDILSHIDTDEAVLMFSSSTRASIVKPTSQPEGENLLMLVMPVRLNT